MTGDSNRKAEKENVRAAVLATKAAAPNDFAMDAQVGRVVDGYGFEIWIFRVQSCGDSVDDTQAFDHLAKTRDVGKNQVAVPDLNLWVHHRQVVMLDGRPCH